MLALALFVATLVLVIWQPGGLGIGWSALLGAAAALLLGIVDLSDLRTVWDIVWDATFTFVALIIISLILDEAGFFEWAALHMARLGGGSARRLFALVILLGAVIAAFFANDGAALLLTPIVLAMLLRLGFAPTAAFAFVIACGFVADTTSLPLVISNLVNIVTANFFGITFGAYAAVMVPVNLVSLAATLAVLFVFFGKGLPEGYDRAKLAEPMAAVKDRTVFVTAFPLFAVLLVAYFVTGPLGVPVAFVTGLGALVLLAIAGRWVLPGRPVVSLPKVLREAPWQIVLFSVGMYLVVYGLGNAGLTDLSSQWLETLARQGDLVATLGTGVSVALLASIMNNMPSTLVGALAIAQADVADHTRQLMVHAHIVGNDLGPKLTPIGSLATLLWLHVLARKGMRIGWGEYCRVGLILTPPVLLATLLALYLWLPLTTD